MILLSSEIHISAKQYLLKSKMNVIFSLILRHHYIIYIHKTYTFSDGRRINVTSGDIIYLPKYSFYEVLVEHFVDCYAINFNIDEETDFAPFAFHVTTKAKFTNFTIVQQKYGI